MPGKSVGLAFTEKDKDIIAWVNMLTEVGQSPRQWIEAIMIENLHGRTLNAGSVKITPKTPPQKTQSKSMLFGDDSITKPNKVTYSWNTKGQNGEYIPGSVFNINVRRPETLKILTDLQKKKVPISKYVKMLIRKSIKLSDENIPPDENVVQEILIMSKMRGEYAPEELAPSTERQQKTSAPIPLVKAENTPPKITTPPAQNPPEAPAKPKNPLLQYFS